MLNKTPLAVLLTLAAAAAGAQARTELTVYTALELDQLKAYQAAFERENPDIAIRWVRDSTGIITARLLAEKENPQADVIWGLAATSLMLMDQHDMLAPYAPAGLDQLSPEFRDPRETPRWVGMDAWLGVICYNTVEAEKHGLSKPTSWQDLTRPEYRGHIVMPNPASSGTGFLDVSAWLQQFGEEKGWAYMDALHQNIVNYSHSGSKPCVQAASGEAAIGISMAYRGARLKQQGAPLELVFPTEGVGWEMEAAAIVKGTGKDAAARKLLDFAISRDANELYNQSFAVVGLPGVAQPVQYFPEQPAAVMIDNDFAWAAGQREAILSEWQRRYDGKSEAR
ncbi:putative 2-aminoethylphosphonate ABC transporter substrate-binding protein [Zobellella endophytica]|uniref:Putative 2-aminoethylphosphonate ABC transporter substrate-binding protein n=1 Tax=Zobellella endophytica TaxID=2116700 RepID=A0A2P7R2K2_9GAMM|nr:putative 2-aminoethylphosphonate ABC transporter substrate-binding protein [Zobellella endophytica]PSJ44434.1 putative 2-aminoethylphosphonate ABC transporter substrate-binding protein [Zobellella endophytica]